MSKPKLKVISDRINKHLHRFEADPKINKNWIYHETRKTWVEDPQRKGTSDYYHAGAYATGHYVRVVYVAYQGPCRLTREEAEYYLAWLDAGNVGTHFSALRKREASK